MTMNLWKFPSPSALDATELLARLESSRVLYIPNFVLGPAGTNMEQASRAWLMKHELDDKAEIVLCPTPEEALAQARLIQETGVVPFFWTCAVFYALNQLFFGNPDTFPFLFSYSHPLDNMQLCCRPELKKMDWDRGWRLSSHPSPAPLVKSLGNEIVFTTSNAQAAVLCAEGEVEACVTTAQAARRHGLATVHEFGSPAMVFFAGTTQHGIDVLLGK